MTHRGPAIAVRGCCIDWRKWYCDFDRRGFERPTPTTMIARFSESVKLPPRPTETKRAGHLASPDGLCRCQAVQAVYCRSGLACPYSASVGGCRDHSLAFRANAGYLAYHRTSSKLLSCRNNSDNTFVTIRSSSPDCCDHGSVISFGGYPQCMSQRCS